MDSNVSVILHLQRGIQNKILPRIKLRACEGDHVLLQTTRALEPKRLVMELCEAIGLDVVALRENPPEHATDIVITKDSIRTVLEAALEGTLRLELIEDHAEKISGNQE